VREREVERLRGGREGAELLLPLEILMNQRLCGEERVIALTVTVTQ